MLAQILAGKPPSETEAASFAERYRDARLAEFAAGDPGLRAAARVAGGGPRYLAALIGLLDTVIPDPAPSADAGTRQDGGR